jgi:2,5-dihydroxypyridine 5,6-dioxygenase
MATVKLTKSDLKSLEKLVECSDVHKGDRVLITSDPYTEPVIPQAVGKACREKGAIVFELLMPNPILDVHEADSAHVYEFFTRGIQGGVDLWMSCNVGPTNTFSWGAQMEYGTGFVQVQALSLEDLRSDNWRFPIELQAEIFKRVGQLIEGKRELRVTSRGGTDITFEIPKGKISFFGDGMLTKLTRPGNRLDYPGACLAFFSKSADGVFVVDYWAPLSAPVGRKKNPFTDPQNPLVLTVKDGFITDAKGDMSKELLGIFEKTGNKLSRYVNGPMVGVCPKATPVGWPKREPIQWYYAYHNSPLVSWLLTGAKGGMSYRREPSAPFMLTLYNYKPTYTVDGEVILQNGRFSCMDDPELRKIASRFGDPDELLKTTPFPPEMFEKGPGAKAVLDKLLKG